MDTTTSSQLKAFQCPIHPNDTIQRISLSQNAPFPLFCIECILSPQIQSLQLPMINLATFLDETSQYYRTHKASPPLSSTVPDDLLSVLKTRQASITEFTQHIESQKAQVIETAAQTLDIIKKCLDQKRDELLQNLDLQLIIFETNFEYYEAKINSFYGKEEIITPQGKDQLIQKINSFEAIEQFVIFLQQFKDDLKEKQRTERDVQINQRLREMSKELMEQANTKSNFMKDREEIFTQVKTNILPVISECFTQASPSIELLSYTGYSGLDIEKLVHLLQTDDHAINDIFKHLNKYSTGKSLAEIFLAKQASFDKLSNIISSTNPNKEKALLILCDMLGDKTVIPIMKKYFNQCSQSMNVGLKSENEQVLLTILRSIQTIFSDPYQIFDGPNQDVYNALYQKGIIRTLLKLRESKYSSVRNLYKQTISYIGDEYEMIEDERYYQEELGYREADEADIFKNAKPKKKEEEIYEDESECESESEDLEKEYDFEDQDKVPEEKPKKPKVAAAPTIKQSLYQHDGPLFPPKKEKW